jgi:hypothetical protein
MLQEILRHRPSTSGDHTCVIRKAHEDPRYHHFIGQFKKLGVGMLVVIIDMIRHVLYAS